MTIFTGQQYNRSTKLWNLFLKTANWQKLVDFLPTRHGNIAHPWPMGHTYFPSCLILINAICCSLVGIDASIHTVTLSPTLLSTMPKIETRTQSALANRNSITLIKHLYSALSSTHSYRTQLLTDLTAQADAHNQRQTIFGQRNRLDWIRLCISYISYLTLSIG